VIHSFSHLEGASAGAAVTIGPFARLQRAPLSQNFDGRSLGLSFIVIAE
jgi:bifunctional N-acetylglucosamine-1-phosphate-uridyltransferase/glucosamine-1-phosphate-acetyltransferase GlmU-like protein